MAEVFEEALNWVFVSFQFESRPRGVRVRVVPVEGQDTLSDSFLPIRDARRLVGWLLRPSDQPFSTPEWTLSRVEDDPDLRFVLRRESKAGETLWVAGLEVQSAIETLEILLDP